MDNAGDRDEAAQRLIPDGPPVLALGPTANWRAKTWRSDHFAELIGRLTGPGGILPGCRVAIFGRDDERPMALRLIEEIPAESCIDLVGKLDLLTVYACLARCDFYVGNDSGLMHLAAASGVPTLGLFGPTRKPCMPPGASIQELSEPKFRLKKFFRLNSTIGRRTVSWIV